MKCIHSRKLRYKRTRDKNSFTAIIIFLKVETNVTVKQDKLDMFSAPVGSAFQCDVLSTISSNESLMMIMMNSTHIQPFNVTDSKFGNGEYMLYRFAICIIASFY